ncbi:hypothetical protein JB92DRAFT_3288853 [Gautieria morchelliformis]|nr:hypothetical protein JB92DRAFT_3288853 [Gautieria morchelliformis]
MSHTHHVQTAPEELPVLEKTPVVEGMDPAHNNSAPTSHGDHNRRVPINRLPVEMLSMIFSLNIPKEKHSVKNMSSILPMTWVCGRWRSVALNFAEFWTLIDLSHSPELIEAALERSNGANLTIDLMEERMIDVREEDRMINMIRRLMDPLRIDPRRRDPDTKRPLADPLMNRAVALELHLTRRQWEHILPIIQQPAPSLRHLVLRTSDDIHNPELKFHNQFLDKGQLHTLTYDMSHCLPWDCLPPLTHVLRELKLSVYMSSPDSPRQLFDFLKACPKLEHLDLQVDATYFVSTWRVDIAPTLMMPRLVKLTLHNTTTTHIVDHLNAPCLRQCVITFDPSQQRFPQQRFPQQTLGHFLVKNLDISKAPKLSIVTEPTNEICFWAPSISSRPTSRSGSYVGPDSGLLDELLDPMLKLTFEDSVPYDTCIKPLYESLIVQASDFKKLVLRGNQPQHERDNAQYHRDHPYRDPGFPPPPDFRPLIPFARTMRGFQQKILEPVDSIQELVIESGDNMLTILPLLEEGKGRRLCPRITTLSFAGASGKPSFGQKLVDTAKHRQGTMTEIQLLECHPILAPKWIGRLKKKHEIDCIVSNRDEDIAEEEPA